MVTENLYDALQQIRKHLPLLQRVVQKKLGRRVEGFCLWDDALCVNQDDTDEKSRQVPRMRDIYSKAYNVPIWLGSTMGMDLDPRGFTAFLREAYKAVPTDSLFAPKESEPYFAENLGLSPYTLQMFNATTKITQLPWFKRVWVTQEFALGQPQPWALLGD